MVVRQVTRDTPAERAGVRPGDVITHFAGQPVPGPAELQRAVEQAPVDSRQELRVIRGGKPMKLTVTTEALPSEVAGGGRGRIQPRDDESVLHEELGLQLTDLTDELAERLQLDPMLKGAVVLRVERGGIAQESGLVRGMLITEVDHQPISSVQEFQDAIKDKSLDRGITLNVEVPGVGIQFLILKRR